MKKLFLSFAVIATMGLVSCGSKEAANEEAAAEPVQTEEAAPAAEEAAPAAEEATEATEGETAEAPAAEEAPAEAPAENA